jgi:alcohol dehydrogenase YqhD (iron-dependent ADH family)
MLNAVYRNPTTIYFGKDVEGLVGEEVKKHSQKILLLYGSASFKTHGLHAKIIQSLQKAGVTFVECGGVKSNPEASIVYQGIELCRREGLDFILSVGGGSVIDAGKAIALGVPYEGDFFDFFTKQATPQKSLPLGVVLTLFGAGSESSDGAVITHPSCRIKTDCSTPLLYPRFAFLNPELTRTAPVHTVRCGISDALSHLFERYFTQTSFVDCTDRIGEGLMRTLMHYGRLIGTEADTYDVRAELMWACKLAHDNTAGFGRKHDWSCHRISHEIGARYEAAHGAILAVLFPAWMEYVYPSHEQRFLQFANRVFDIDTEAPEKKYAITQALETYRLFLQALGMPSTLRELGLTDKAELEDIARHCTATTQSGTLGNFVRLSNADIVKLLTTAF